MAAKPKKVSCPGCAGRGGFTYRPGCWIVCSVCDGARKLAPAMAERVSGEYRNLEAARELSRSKLALTDEHIQRIKRGIGEA